MDFLDHVVEVGLKCFMSRSCFYLFKCSRDVGSLLVDSGIL